MINKNFNRHRGIALFLVLGMIALFVPVLIFLTQTGSSQVKQAMKFHEALQCESVALSGTSSGFSKLQGNQTGFQQLTGVMVGNYPCDLTIQPTGNGFLGQNLYNLFGQSVLGKHTYTLMVDGEQCQPDPSPPVTVLPHDFWNTIEPYNITLAADIISMRNYRGLDLLQYERTKIYEKGLSKDAYEAEMLQKKNMGLPTPLKNDWGAIAALMKEAKIE